MVRVVGRFYENKTVPHVGCDLTFSFQHIRICATYQMAQWFLTDIELLKKIVDIFEDFAMSRKEIIIIITITDDLIIHMVVVLVK